MIYDCSDGTYLFGYSLPEDCSADWDEMYENTTEAKQTCLNEYDIGPEDWTAIPDPPEDCQHDWIAPVRVKGRNLGKPEWGQLEHLIDGEWKVKNSVTKE